MVKLICYVCFGNYCSKYFSSLCVNLMDYVLFLALFVFRMLLMLFYFVIGLLVLVIYRICKSVVAFGFVDLDLLIKALNIFSP